MGKGKGQRVKADDSFGDAKHKVMIDVDLADLYEVPTKRLNEQVRRNRKRFPKDFVFRLTKTEAEALRSQFATSKTSRWEFRVNKAH